MMYNKEEIYPHNDTSNLSAQNGNMNETGREKKETKRYTPSTRQVEKLQGETVLTSRY